MPQEVWRERELIGLMLTKFRHCLGRRAIAGVSMLSPLLSVKIWTLYPLAASRAKSQGSTMTYVVTETCIKCKYTDCVDVCPVDCFREGPNMLVIDPDECIDCTLCVAECPVEAIFAEDDVPDAPARIHPAERRARQGLEAHHREEGRSAGRRRVGEGEGEGASAREVIMAPSNVGISAFQGRIPASGAPAQPSTRHASEWAKVKEKDHLLEK